MDNIWLIQRCNKRSQDVSGSFDDVFKLDYMGSSEFEWGAVPESLTRILNYYKSYQIERFIELKNFEGLDLILFHNFNKTDLEKYINFLRNSSVGNEHLKESTYLEYNIIGKLSSNKTQFKDSYWRVDLWWDILNDVFFFFGDDMKNTLIQTLQNTEMKRSEVKQK